MTNGVRKDEEFSGTREVEERAARLAAILVGESPYQHRSPVDAVVISNNEKGD